MFSYLFELFKCGGQFVARYKWIFNTLQMGL